MPKLSESLPMQLSHEEGEGWKMDTVDLANWLKELAEELEAQAGRLDILEGKRKQQAPVDRRLVEEALGVVVGVRDERFYLPGTPLDLSLAQIIRLLRRALEGDSDAQD